MHVKMDSSIWQVDLDARNVSVTQLDLKTVLVMLELASVTARMELSDLGK